jgi:hypothetical protein
MVGFFRCAMNELDCKVIDLHEKFELRVRELMRLAATPNRRNHTTDDTESNPKSRSHNRQQKPR